MLSLVVVGDVASGVVVADIAVVAVAYGAVAVVQMVCLFGVIGMRFTYTKHFLPASWVASGSEISKVRSPGSDY